MRSKLFLNPNLFKTLVLVVLSAIGFSGWTLARAYEMKTHSEVSAQKPVKIAADQLTFDRLQGLTLFTGNVKAVHEQILLLSNRIRALEDNREASAEGKVQVIDSSQSITLSCGNLEYKDLMNVMTAHDHPLLTTLDENGHPITVEGRQMELDSTAKTVVINQNVRIVHDAGHSESQKATFLSQRDEFILEDDPKVFTDNGLLSGRRIVTKMGGDRGILVEGMADAVFNPNGKPVTDQSSPKNGPQSIMGAPGGQAGTSAIPSQSVTNPNGLGNNATNPAGGGAPAHP